MKSSLIYHAGWQNSKSETNFFSGVLCSLEANNINTAAAAVASAMWSAILHLPSDRLELKMRKEYLDAMEGLYIELRTTIILTQTTLRMYWIEPRKAAFSCLLPYKDTPFDEQKNNGS